MRAEFAAPRGCGLSRIRLRLRLSGEGDARDLLQVFNEAKIVPLCQQKGDRFALAVSDFEGE